MELYNCLDVVKKAAELLAKLLIDFLKKQKELIGDPLTRPGHGFDSSRVFQGVGLSDDTSIMVSGEDYENIFVPADVLVTEHFGGMVYHSCGVWEQKINVVKEIPNIWMADGAFTIETDPALNNPEIFGEAFAGSGIILNARAVGNVENCVDTFKKLWKTDQKLIAVTYCKTPEEQAEAYERIHRLAGC